MKFFFYFSPISLLNKITFSWNESSSITNGIGKGSSTLCYKVALNSFQTLEYRMVGGASSGTDKCLTVVHSIVCIRWHNWQIMDIVIRCPEVMMNVRTYGLKMSLSKDIILQVSI